MSYSNYPPQYVTPNSYNFNPRHEMGSPDEYFLQASGYSQNRHGSHDYTPYNMERSYEFNGYDGHNSHGGARQYPSAIEPIRGGSGTYEQTGRHGSYSSSPTTTSGSSMSRHPSRESEHEMHSRTSSSSDERAFCPHDDCKDEQTGLPTRFFSRKADVQRHIKSQHGEPCIDCPRPKCNRRGQHGFTRQDHCIEHLRQYHGQDIPKRGGGGHLKGGSKSRHSA